jgi:non-specific serine/threonine protein kinase
VVDDRDRPERYTQVERATLWLVPEGDDVDPFYVCRTVVTNLQYEEFDPGHARSALTSDDTHPVVNVSWAEAKAYCAWYAELSHKPFRLPSDPEWLHGCTAERDTRFFWGRKADRADTYVVDADNFDGTLRLESRKANPFGLHDTIGTVWEWTDSGVIRGGSFRTARSRLSCDLNETPPDGAGRDDVGFRFVRALRFGPQRRDG